LKLVRSYPIAVGQVGLQTPAGIYHIQDKVVNPSWQVPFSSWTGSLAGRLIPPGPDDPLKARWLGIFNGAGIHGTEETWSIGHAVSHGCVRMTIPDVIDLYDRLRGGTRIAGITRGGCDHGAEAAAEAAARACAVARPARQVGPNPDVPRARARAGERDVPGALRAAGRAGGADELALSQRLSRRDTEAGVRLLAPRSPAAAKADRALLRRRLPERLHRRAADAAPPS